MGSIQFLTVTGRWSYGFTARRGCRFSVAVFDGLTAVVDAVKHRCELPVGVVMFCCCCFSALFSECIIDECLALIKSLLLLIIPFKRPL